MFYPGQASTLAGLVDHLVGAVPVPDDDRLAVAYVVPHAGFRYSGPVAATVYARLRRHAAAVRRVVLIGPAHREALTGCAVTGAAIWRTPLGAVAVDTAGAAALPGAVQPGLATVDDGPHEREHSLEVQIPFLQRVLDPDVVILPVCVGGSTPELIAEVLTALGCGAPGTVVLCSTDLSHYLPDDEARARDRRTAAAVVELSPERIGPRDACGGFALRGLLRWARSESLGIPEVLALATSADTGADPGRVVGYPAFAFGRPPAVGTAAPPQGDPEPDRGTATPGQPV